MSDTSITFAGGPIFDGEVMLNGYAARFIDGALDSLVPEVQVPSGEPVEDLSGDILSPGYVDLQVNGGGGVMFNDDPSIETLHRIAKAHRQLGATSILPTLITDTPEKTTAAISAATQAVRDKTPGIVGLHLEGPHLCQRRKGAHDGALIRSMEDADLQQLTAAAKALPVLMVTLAPESVTIAQVETLVHAGAVVSLGHSDAPFETCVAYARAGAQCATHLFNAMSQLGNREPGLVGAVLSCGAMSAGLIADAIHVHPETMRTAFAAKQGPGHLFLVSDAMAVAGTELSEFTLEGRIIQRKNGRLTLQDGTLAGADLDLTTALRVLTADVGVSLPDALAAATRIPAGLISQGAICRLNSISQAIRISADLSQVRPVVAL
ncbi:N-acetylglucosamine 6-phosphate deacetylase [Ruegeria halocynthiae]|uniref:N-acetylglucosamine 6-phosphate deacetylase n=1 Tax=Ruegeria halocynthiae TaxID=985054 RepID=A0A1H2UC39_9RHOB|nr:N-acetylglucosamine-6-phosphate deacetylase [Ruegeria halocynthiae]SDW53650.1 N-acetylglucosamine 6-phosphate deacetylase [Ruegeria halocynthiae]